MQPPPTPPPAGGPPPQQSHHRPTPAHPLCRLLEDLAAFDWKQAAEKEGLPSSLSVVEHLSQLLSWGKQAAGDTTSQGTSSTSTKAAAAAVAGGGGPAAALAAAAAAQGEQEGAAAAAAAAVVHPGEPIMRSMAARTAAKDPGLSQEGEKYNPYVPVRFKYAPPA